MLLRRHRRWLPHQRREERGGRWLRKSGHSSARINTSISVRPRLQLELSESARVLCLHTFCIISIGSSFLTFKIRCASSSVMLSCDVMAPFPPPPLGEDVAAAAPSGLTLKSVESELYYLKDPCHCSRTAAMRPEDSLLTACAPAAAVALPSTRIPVTTSSAMTLGADIFRCHYTLLMYAKLRWI